MGAFLCLPAPDYHPALNTLRSIWVWTAISVLILVWVPVMFTIHLLDRDPGKYSTGRWFRRLGSAMTRVNPGWRIRISGDYPANPRTPYIVVANHQSNADIPVFSRLPWDMKWVGKASLFRLPVLGWMMRVSRDIPVDRTSRTSRARVLGEAADRLRQHVSVMIMPEGTRSRDGKVGRFNDGAFALAIKLGIPVLPVAVDGTSDALPKKSWRFGPPSDIRLHVFSPVTADAGEDAAAFRERVRTMILEQIAAWRGTTSAQVDRTAKTSDS